MTTTFDHTHALPAIPGSEPTSPTSPTHADRPPSPAHPLAEQDLGEPPVRLLGINYTPDGDGNRDRDRARTSEDAEADGDLGDLTVVAQESLSTDAHPLRLDLSSTPSPSPPPWEVLDPPLAPGDEEGWHKPEASFAKKQTRKLKPVSSYYFGPPPPDAAYGTDPIGRIGVHHPREIVRVERDYSGGDIVQFADTYPLELEGRITHTQFLETINAINEVLIEAHSLRWSAFDTFLDIFTLHVSSLFVSSHYDREMRRLQRIIGELNRQLYNPMGLNILWPRNVAFLFLEIEYY